MGARSTFLRLALALAVLAAMVAAAQPVAPRAGATAGTAASPASHDAALRDAVRGAVARQFGVRVEDVGEGTDLLRDLHADPLDAYELVVRLCRERGVVAPARDDLVTVGAIVAYLRTAPRAEAAVPQRGWTTSTGTAREVPPRVILRKILFVTDRAPMDSAAGDPYFGGERQPGDRLNYGSCEVTIPTAVHRAGETEEPAWYRLEWEDDPSRHFTLKAVRPLERGAFFADLRSGLAAGRAETFVFVHGYNVSFPKAARRTAQIAYDLGFAGVPILFSWPSAARFASYFSDRENAEWSAGHLARFLEDLLAEAPAGRVHVLAHSMGNQALIRALVDLAARRGPAARPLFDNVVLAAPDFDAQLFVEQLAPRVVGLARQWTIYASDKDRALDAAAALSARRLGLPLPVARGVDTVDASGIDVAPWSVPEFHTYFASKQRVITDLAQVLRGTPANRRNLVPRTKDQLTYWVLAPL